jgi:glycosyltransferase involved in cell wall biosynthesis
LGGRFYLCWQSGLIEWLEQWQPAALVIDANPRYLTSRLAIRWMHKHGRPVMGWGLGLMPGSSGREWFRGIGRRRFVRSFDGMFAYSTRGARQYEAMGVPADRIFVAKNAATFRPTRPPATRSKDGGPPVVLFVGKLSEAKRVENLLRACSALEPAMRPRLQIVGDGPEGPRLRQLASSIYPQAEFPGAKYGTDLDRIFDSADLFVLPGMGGLAIQEAMAHALPVIVAEADGTQDDLVRPGNGWNIAPNNLGDLVRALREALANPERLAAMGAASYRIVAEEINIENMVTVFVRGLNATRQRVLGEPAPVAGHRT